MGLEGVGQEAESLTRTVVRALRSGFRAIPFDGAERMRSLRAWLCAWVGAAALGACASGSQSETEPQTMCTMEARSSFAVTVVDSASGAPVRTGATVRVTDGAFSDTLVAPGPQSSAYSGGVYERAGTYTVAVAHADYRPWQRTGVAVARDECHVQTQALTARLQRR